MTRDEAQELTADLLTDSFKALVESRQQEFSGETFDSLWNVLRAAQPAFEGVVEYNDSTAVFAASPEDEIHWYHQNYKVGSDGTVALSGEPIEVEPHALYKAVGDETRALACYCRGVRNMDEKIENLVGRLVASSASPFTDEDTETLSRFTEERLLSMLDHCEPKSEEEAIAALPEPLQATLRKYQKREEEERNNLISSLAKAQSVFSEEQLNSKETSELEALSQLINLNEGPADYSGRGLAQNRNEAPEMPDPYAAGIAALQKAN